ncbi:hypothetical protein QBC38DRAFT_489312 [Podospora fimiseda]|uniref:NACHT-NTPase and P-loop NTPases N-terminal domain-containing protein n=1 Tax=Podospora fimiseda TaxID=252190 RepID=A0AAN7BFT1_9PEZI|nr:hypothetical protein QBC38DRAFT_489312 [Podospora fimiseda]
MDPWSGIQYASAVLGIVDVVGNFISLAYRAYTGSLDLQPTADDLKVQLQTLQRLKQDTQQKQTANTASQADDEIVKLFEECEKVILSLIEIINKIISKSTNPTVLSSLREALKTLWNQK